MSSTDQQQPAMGKRRRVPAGSSAAAGQNHTPTGRQQQQQHRQQPPVYVISSGDESAPVARPSKRRVVRTSQSDNPAPGSAGGPSATAQAAQWMQQHQGEQEPRHLRGQGRQGQGQGQTQEQVPTTRAGSGPVEVPTERAVGADRPLVKAGTTFPRGQLVDRQFLPLRPAEALRKWIGSPTERLVFDSVPVVLQARLGIPPNDTHPPAPDGSVFFEASAVQVDRRSLVTAVRIETIETKPRRQRRHRGPDEYHYRYAAEQIPAYSTFVRPPGAKGDMRLPALDLGQLNEFPRLKCVIIDAAGPDDNTASAWFLGVDRASMQPRGQQLAALKERQLMLIVDLNAWLHGGPVPPSNDIEVWSDPEGTDGPITAKFRKALAVGENVDFGIAVNTGYLDAWAVERYYGGGKSGSTRASQKEELARYWIESVQLSDEEYPAKGTAFRPSGVAGLDLAAWLPRPLADPLGRGATEAMEGVER